MYIKIKNILLHIAFLLLMHRNLANNSDTFSLYSPRMAFDTWCDKRGSWWFNFEILLPYNIAGLSFSIRYQPTKYYIIYLYKFCIQYLMSILSCNPIYSVNKKKILFKKHHGVISDVIVQNYTYYQMFLTSIKNDFVYITRYDFFRF